MISIDETRLNPLERRVLDTLSEYSKSHPEPRIVAAAEVCNCSVSQVSKAIKKAGFKGYKQYIRFLYFGEYPGQETLDELERLKMFINEFDLSLLDEFVEMITGHTKIILFGYGPSLICAQYVEYKLRFCIQAFIATPPDEASLRNLVDESTLLLILTTTGQFRSFETPIRYAKSKGAEVVVVSEEFNPVLMENCDRYFNLSHHKQPETLEPHEKTRTIFFIFFEQVVQKILSSRRLNPA